MFSPDMLQIMRGRLGLGQTNYGAGAQMGGYGGLAGGFQPVINPASVTGGVVKHWYGPGSPVMPGMGTEGGAQHPLDPVGPVGMGGRLDWGMGQHPTDPVGPLHRAGMMGRPWWMM